MNRTFAALIIIFCLLLSACAATPGRVPEEQETAMVLIPAGPFIMGSNPDDEKRGVIVGIDEQPEQTVNLPAYYIDKYEVTNAQYKKFIDSTGHKTPFDWKDNMYPESEERFPVAHVNWFDADAYCSWAGGRLPTEAEWEKAARGTDGRIYPWGDTFDMNKANTKDWDRERVEVGTFPEGASPYGLLDMSGNVWEWTSNWYEAYPGSTLERTDFGEKYKVIRGGAWNARGDLARSNERFPYLPGESYQCYIGVRCVKNVK